MIESMGRVIYLKQSLFFLFSRHRESEVYGKGEMFFREIAGAHGNCRF